MASILVLGGTGFLGPHVVAAARARGHAVTLFNRGKTRPELFPDVETLTGDRDGKLDLLKGRRWDAVVDNCGYVPRIVRMSADLLADSAGHYVFVSTISVYVDGLPPGADEDAPLRQLGEPGSEEVRKYYGELKALCEGAVEEAMPGRATVIRPGLIVGPGDPTDRFTYWPARIARGGEVLAPGDGQDLVQIIDVRDLAELIVTVVERRTSGIMNAVGPRDRLTMGELLAACASAAGTSPSLTWVPAEALAELGVAPWSDMPAWVPGDGLTSLKNDRAIAAGLAFRRLEDTCRDTLAFWQGLPPERRAAPRAGITPEREMEILSVWRQRARPAMEGDGAPS